VSFVNVQVEISIPFEDWLPALNMAVAASTQIGPASAEVRELVGQSRAAYVAAMEDSEVSESRYASIETGASMPTVIEARDILDRMEAAIADHNNPPVPTEDPPPPPPAPETDLPV
jgi:hypothetical protein